MELREYKVWDWPQRLFHWINALAVLTLAAIGLVILNDDALGIPNDPGVLALKTAHVYVGYVFVLNLAWRVVWGFVGGEPRQSAPRSAAEVPARTPESDALSRALRERGFTFVGSTICYAFMQAAGLVNDHVVDCFRHAELARSTTRTRRRP